MPTSWKKGESLGSGSFGSVFLALSDNGELLAVKEVNLSSEKRHVEDRLRDLQQEIRLLSTLRHPNIVQYVGYEHRQNNFYIFLEYVAGGSIQTLLGTFGSFDENVIRIYVTQVRPRRPFASPRAPAAPNAPDFPPPPSRGDGARSTRSCRACPSCTRRRRCTGTSRAATSSWSATAA